MELVLNEPKYWDFIRELRNTEGIKEGFIDQTFITPEMHNEFMRKWGDNFYICVIDSHPAGYVGVINDDIRVATHPYFQGVGVGTYMIDEIMKLYPGSFAKVKIGNEASLRLFKKCGFKEKYYILEKS
jgi:RimJ/RimL family protein N-acetyltransferase|tara:strand:- start:1803 stop:2186 length:384 start_codon:yes stop_codon:yes gene_type:complete